MLIQVVMRLSKAASAPSYSTGCKQGFGFLCSKMDLRTAQAFCTLGGCLSQRLAAYVRVLCHCLAPYAPVSKMPGFTWCLDADCRLLLGTEANITLAIAEVVLSSKLAKGNHKKLALLMRPREIPYTHW